MHEQLATKLWEARLSGRVLDPSGHVPADAKAAYAIQADITALAEVGVVGFKVGASAEGPMRLLDLTEPFFGPVYDRYRHESGCDVSVTPAHKPGIETEFVIGLDTDLPSRSTPYAREDVESAIGWVAPGFEIVGTRFDCELAGAGLLLIADGGANVDAVTGAPVHDWRRFDLSRHPATLYLNGKEAGSGHSGMSIFGHALGPVAWLASHAALGERGLRAGDVVMTGTCTGLLPVAPGDEARADFGEMGEVSVRFVRAEAE